MEVWQNGGQLSKRVMLKIMLVYLKYSLISMEQLKSKLWEVPAVIDIPLGIWSAWKGRSQPDFAEWAFICLQAKTAAEGNQNMQVQTGCEWGWDRGKKNLILGSWYPCQVYQQDGTCCQRRDRRGARLPDLPSCPAWAWSKGQQCGDVCCECRAHIIPFLC